MRISTALSAGLLLALMPGTNDISAASPQSLEGSLDALNYQVGKEAGEIVDFQIKDRVYLDSRHLIVPHLGHLSCAALTGGLPELPHARCSANQR